tara:strand:+ start:1195 stop:1521 length:327 start_codon:yes stop_codon:yes gene_type:complete
MLISVVGNSPDIFTETIIRYLLDENKGIIRHQKVYYMMVLFYILILIASIKFTLKKELIEIKSWERTITILFNSVPLRTKWEFFTYIYLGKRFEIPNLKAENRVYPLN